MPLDLYRCARKSKSNEGQCQGRAHPRPQFLTGRVAGRATLDKARLSGKKEYGIGKVQTRYVSERTEPICPSS